MTRPYPHGTPTLPKWALWVAACLLGAGIAAGCVWAVVTSHA